MNSFIEEVLFSGFGSDVVRYNNSFFTNNLDSKRICKFINIYRSYIKLINLIKEKDSLYTNSEIDNYEVSMKNIKNDISNLVEEIKRLTSEKIKLEESAANLYNLADTEFEVIEKLIQKSKEAGEAIDRSHQLVKNKSELYVKIRKNKNEKEAIKVAYESMIKDGMRELKIMIEELENDFSLNTDIDGLRTKYEEGLRQFIPNGLTREVYSDYIFDFIKAELKMFVSSANVADYFVHKATPENDFLSDDVEHENNRIQVFEKLDSITHRALGDLANVWGVSLKSGELAQAYASVQNLIIRMLDYVLHPETKYEEDYDIITEDYLGLCKAKQDSRKKTIIENFFAPKYAYITEPEEIAYDYAISAYDSFNNSEFLSAELNSIPERIKL